ncbi:MAG: hypothetical protein AABZ44_10050 [Elusimicrobiota bacterium]
MSKDNDIPLVGAGFAAGFWLFYQGFKALRLKRLIAGMATSKTRSVAMGTVELAGMTRQLHLLDDPVFHEPCVYFSITVEIERGSGKNRRWVKVYDASSSNTPFALVDDAGFIPVYPEGAETHCELDIDTTLTVGGPSMVSADPAAMIPGFLRSIGRSHGRYRVRANILREKEPIYILGYATTTELHHTLRQRLRAKLDPRNIAQLLKGDAQKMKTADANSDNVIDGSEWDAAIARLSAEIYAQEAPAADAEPAPKAPQALIRKSPDGLLVIADKQEREFLDHLAANAILKIFGGPLLTLACGAYLWWRLLG